MKAMDVMTANVITVAPDAKVVDIAKTLYEKRISAVPVIDGGEVVGIVSEGDLLRRHEISTERHDGSWLMGLFRADPSPADFKKSFGLTARDVMTKDVISVNEDTPLTEIADIFETRLIKRVPVIRDGKLVGIVSRANLIQALALAGEVLVKPARADDSSIRESLLDTLNHQPWWSSNTSNVIVADGVVHFWGIEGTPEERDAARIAAENVEGVRGVNDHRTDLLSLNYPD